MMEVMGIDLAKVGIAISYTLGGIIGFVLMSYIVYFWSKLQMKAWMSEFFKHINEQDGKEKNEKFQEQDR